MRQREQLSANHTASSPPKDLADQVIGRGSRRYRPDIQGLRAIAVLLVVIYHSGLQLTGGFVGVDVFFVVSGYVITATLMSELDREQHLNFRRFYSRRIRRLIPALAVVLVVTLAASILLATLDAQQITARTGVATALLNANSYLIFKADVGGYFEVGAEANPLLHTWSLSVEEQFYLLFPALVAGAWALGRRWSRGSRLSVTIMLLFLVVTTSPLAWLLTTERLNPAGIGSDIAFYAAPARAWEFAVGALLALGANRLVHLRFGIGAVAAIMGASLLASAAFLFDRATQFPGSAAWVPVAGAGLLIASGDTQFFSASDRLFGSRPLQYVGNISYSWYLWHWPFIVFAAALWPSPGWVKAVAAAGSLLPAALSYHFVENPIRFSSELHWRRTIAIVAVGVLAPLGAGFGLNFAHEQLKRSDLEDRFVSRGDTTCISDRTVSERDLSECTWNATSSRGSAVLIGDSNAWHFGDAFATAANKLGYDAVVVAMPSCPLVDLVIALRGVEDPACRSFVAEAMDEFTSDPPDVVVLAAATDIYLDDSEYQLRSPSSGERYRSTSAKAQAWEAALAATMEQLDRAGSKVVTILPVPRLMNGWDPQSIAVARLLQESTDYVGVDRDDADRARQEALSVERSAADGRALVVDLFDSVCPDSRCELMDGDVQVFRDWSHLAPEGSRRLSAPLALKLEAGLDG